MTQATCRICGTAQDWLTFGVRKPRPAATTPQVDYGTPTNRLNLDHYREVVTICPEGHGVAFMGLGREPLQRQLNNRITGTGRVVAIWASQAGGKTVLVQRIIRARVPDRANGRRLPLGIISGQGHGLDIMLRAEVDRGTAQDDNTCRRVLIRYLEEKAQLNTDEASLLLEQALVAAGLPNEQRVLNAWGSQRQPYTPPYHFTRLADTTSARARWTAWLWLMDEAGELHAKTGDALVANGTAETVALIIDAANAPQVFDRLLRDDRWRRRVIMSRRVPRFGDPDTPDESTNVDADIATHRQRAAERLTLNQDVVHKTPMLKRPAVAVTLTKLDLVAAALEVIAQDADQPRSGTPLWHLLGRRQNACLDAASESLVWWTSHWLEPSRATRLSPAAHAFLRLVGQAGDNNLAIARRITRGVIDHFGTANKFWSLVTDDQPHLLPAEPLTGRAGEGWEVEDLSTCLRNLENGALLNLRDVVTMILGRALVVAFGYNQHDMDALAPVAIPGDPEMYFLTSALEDYRVDADDYRNQLGNPSFMNAGLEHLCYWLLKPFMQDHLR